MCLVFFSTLFAVLQLLLSFCAQAALPFMLPSRNWIDPDISHTELPSNPELEGGRFRLNFQLIASVHEEDKQYTARTRYN